MSTFPYVLAVLAAAGVDTLSNMMLKKSCGFKFKKYGILALFLVACAFTLLAFALHGMDLTVAYAMWGAFGILGTSLGGWLFFGQKVRPVAWVGIVAVVSGILLMHFS